MTNNQVEARKAPAVLSEYSEKHGMDPAQMWVTLKDTIFPTGRNAAPPSKEQVYSLLIVAERYGLDPFLKELYAFPSKGGGIIPIVSVDGWYALINRQSSFDGVETEPIVDDKGNHIACKAVMYRKDRSHPVTVIEYVKECSTGSPAWQKSPGRMIRHRAIVQAARIAFSLSGVYDPDEAEQIRDAQFSVASNTAPATGEGVDDINAAIEARAQVVEPEGPEETTAFVDPESGDVIEETVDVQGGE